MLSRITACRRKKRYPTKKSVRWALLRMWSKGRPERSFYPCEICGGFHITSLPPEGGEREI
jgi:hypothetical protein